MKKLKLDHRLAEMVRDRSKTSTWRLYDDKDISVNDEVELIDKVDPQDPRTWNSIGVAKVNQVIEKRLGEITKADSRGHEEFRDRDEMLKSYQQYYGPQVTFDTPVKMIHFNFDNNKKGDSLANATVTEAKIYADGGSRGNPGPSASGFAIMDMNDRIIVKKGVYLGVTTNNQAEYQSLKLALEEARSMGIREVHVFMDSLLVINQMRGIFKVKNRDLWPINEAVRQLGDSFKRVTYTHVPRSLNKIADTEVNEALDAAEET